MATINEYDRRRIVRNLDTLIAKWGAYAARQKAMNKAGARGVKYQPMGSMRVTPAREIYRGVDIAVSDAGTLAAVKSALDKLAARSDGTLAMVQGVTIHQVQSSKDKTAGKWYAACYKGGRLEVTEHMQELDSATKTFVVLHEFAHHVLKHAHVSRDVSSFSIETEADSLAYRWQWGN
jgi:hypothetical protein